MTSILALLGVLSALGSVAFAFQIAESYVRHLASGDQAGAALGMYFFLAFVAPFTGLVLIGWNVAPERATGAGDPGSVPSEPVVGISKPRVLGGILVQGSGVLMLLFAAATLTMLNPSHLHPPRLTAEHVASVVLGYTLVPVALGLLLWVCGAHLRSSARPSYAFLSTAGAFTVSLIVSLASVFVGLYRQRNEPNVPPTLWGIVLGFHTPTFIMIALMAILVFVYARRLRRARLVAAS